ncbi:hypothetical protein DAEQUDRAFT_676358 [Daedalea quercina L-15889]|uniref:Carbohydrate kinase PfkB domain-containing protein n=1 Tax=Daedalea quercina L-15889 TaxID=1314783 RepID=A0A165MI90_9APHY|nr:hypothetical protein DAEQUDRAFT_676358 [Daedalea quercina L-15889]
MAPGRRNTNESAPNPVHRPLRVVASGTLFLTHTFEVPTHPQPNSVLRASTVVRSRGGSASTCLSILAQFPSVEALLVAPLGGNEDGRKLVRDLERERVSTRFCKVWEEAGVPSAWVLHAGDTDSRTVINNNPLPDITHEDFVSLLGPLLAPENYLYSPPPGPAHGLAHSAANATLKLDALQPRTSMSSIDAVRAPLPLPRTNTSSLAPFDWLHFEGRSVKTTLSNIMGLEGLARERKWRSHCVFSVDVGRRAKQGVEALVPYADVVFLNKHYALAHSPQYSTSPRAFLLSLTTLAAPHALLVAHWGEDGAALLSVPTREYFQSSGWVADPTSPSAAATPLHSRHTTAADDDHDNLDVADAVEVLSVRTGSDFWAGQHTDSSSVFTAGILSSSGTSRTPQSPSPGTSVPQSQFMRQRDRRPGSADSDETQTGRATSGSAPDARRNEMLASEIVDEVGAQDAFVAGMMFALSRRLLPGEPYTPSGVHRGKEVASDVREMGRWRLEECLRFATELAGRKARRRGWEGLAEDMARAGWLEP